MEFKKDYSSYVDLPLSKAKDHESATVKLIPESHAHDCHKSSEKTEGNSFLRLFLYGVLFLGALWVVTKLPAYSELFVDTEENTEVVVIFVQEDVVLAKFNRIMPNKLTNTSTNQMCNLASTGKRFDCFPDTSATKEACEARGCCWKPTSEYRDISSVPVDVPWCFFPKDYSSVQYKAQTVEETDYGYRVTIKNNAPTGQWPPQLINNLQMDVYLESTSRVHFKIIDSQNERYQVPIDTPVVTKKAENPDYDVHIKEDPVGIVISRKKTGTVIFDSTIAPLLFADQYIQMSTSVPSNFVYGLGEHRSALVHNLTSWDRLSFWSRDQPPTVHSNLYGVHPFYLTLEEDDGSANGVFLLNSNAMDVDIVPYPALTYRTIGGILDFYVFLGASPTSVVQQYVEVIGKPAFPPYWALGFHLCRYGYGTAEKLKEVIKRMREGRFPYDTQWSDIDYMDKYRDWTYDKDKFESLPDIVNDLHDQNQHFVIIVDPAISSEYPGEYPPYDTGITNDVFIKNSTGKPIVGRVWPGKTVFPDFTKPETEDWWYTSAKDFHQEISFDGLWTDMNEPSNFVSGSMSGCTNDKHDNPPYTPGILGQKLQDKTLCASAKQHLGLHYDLHSLFGHFEARATHRALQKLTNKRSLVITRSSYVGTGQYAGHWTGDNRATWDDLYYSVPALLSFQMFGIPFVGADICGFGGDTTEELCVRWMQLGAFYPFMRNHNALGQKDQDPAVFSEAAQSAMNLVLDIRYNTMSYLYTQLYRSHVDGTPVMYPLSFLFPGDQNTHHIDRQYMLGHGLLITPVLTEGATTVKAYIPKGVWYDSDWKRVPVSGDYTNLRANLYSYIPMLMRGGFITSWQNRRLRETTTVTSRRLPFSFTAAFDENEESIGELYWDDGETINAVESGQYSLFSLSASQGKLTCSVVKDGYKPERGIHMEQVTLLGIKEKPTTVLLNGASVDFAYFERGVVFVLNQFQDMMTPWTLEWR